MTRGHVLAAHAVAFAFACMAVVACSGETMGRAEGLDATHIPVEARADYDLFARRCSKCHSLARALNSGIDDDAYWQKYVERMRRQPASGISHEDARVILRFLSSYSRDLRRSKAKSLESGGVDRSDGGAP
jgi:hypothetical protein